MLNEHVPWHARLRLGFREWRRTMKSRLPYVRRREHRILEQRHDALAKVFLGAMAPADTAAISVVKDLAEPLRGDICLFVTHAPSETLKPHVAAHVSQLVDAGVSVILIVNTDLPAASIRVEPALLERLSGCVVRENVGLDFAAWAHAHAMFAKRLAPTRLMLVNDSIIGPLDADRYRSLLLRVRASTADVVGLTESFDPRYHLQSFYLVFNARALEPLRQCFGHVLNLPTKDLVIDVYETRLTQHLAAAGLRCEALFPTPARSRHAPPNDTALRWSALVAAGFPFVKASVVDSLRDDPAMQRLVPEQFRQRPQ